MQGILRLRMRLFDFSTPSSSPTARPVRQQPHAGNIYGGYPALAINPFDPAPNLAAAHFLPPAENPPNFPWPRPASAARSRAHLIGTLDSTTPWQPCYQPDRPLQAGFLRSLLKSHLRHLRALQLLRCSKVLDQEDYRSIGCLTQLTELAIVSLVRPSTSASALPTQRFCSCNPVHLLLPLNASAPW